MGQWAKGVRVIKEGTCWDEPWVLYVSDESLNLFLKLLLHFMLTNLDLNFKKEEEEESKLHEVRGFPHLVVSAASLCLQQRQHRAGPLYLLDLKRLLEGMIK